MAQYPLRIVILGAGYAGLLATARLAGRVRREIQRGAVTLTLINAADVFVERLRLHQLAANHAIPPQRPIRTILRGTGVSCVRGVVTGIDVARRTIDMQTDAATPPIAYDTLVYALGSTIDCDRVPGVREHAYVLTPGGPRSAVALRELLPTLNGNNQGKRLLVCGGGATGIEAAAEFAEAYPNVQVHLMTGDAFGGFTEKRVADYMHRRLTRLGVTIQDDTTITAVRANEVQTANGAVVPHDVCLWTGGFTVPRVAREAGLTVNERHQIVVDPFLRSISHPEIYAVGDAAHPLEAPGVAVRMSAYTAAVMGAHGADCVSAALHGQRPRPFSFAYSGQGIALGRHDAIGFNTYPNDRPHVPYLTGRVGYTMREFFVRLLANLPNLERRWPGFFFWVGKGRYAAGQRRARLTASVHTP